MRLAAAFLMVACLSGRTAADDAPLSAVPITIVAGNVTATKTLTLDPDTREADWSLNDELATPVVVVDGVSLEAGRTGELAFRVNYQFAGDTRNDRHMMVEVAALDSSGKTVSHAWAIEGDARIGPHEILMGSSMFTLSNRNSSNIELPAEVVANAKSYRVEFRPLSATDLSHLPDSPHNLKLALKRPTRPDRLEFVFEMDRDIDPARHEIAFTLAIRDAGGKLVERRVRFVPCRADGRYEVCHCVPQEYWQHSSVGLSVYTIQPDNERFRRRFFIEGKGSSYSGIWTGDGGEIARLPYEDSAYR